MFARLFSRSMKSKASLSSLYWRNFGVRFQSTINHAKSPKEPTGIKKLIQQYGYSALGVYLGLSLIDLPICFIVVHSAGEEKIREYQDKFLTLIGYKKEKSAETGASGTEDGNENEEKSSTVVTEFALAYAIHKSLIFVRLPITAAITPWVVKRLQSMGFKIGKLAVSQVKNAAKLKKFDPTGKSSNL